MAPTHASPTAREIIFAVLVAALFFGLGAYLSTFPTEIIRYAGLLVIAASIIGLAVWFWWGYRRPRVATLTPSDIAYNGALVAVVIAWAAAIFRGRRIAIAAAVIATIAVGVDYWFGPPRGLLSPANFLGLEGGPIGWSRVYINDTVIAPSDKPMNINNLTIMGGNLSKEEIKLDDAYFISGMDSSRLDVKIVIAGALYKPQEIKPIPAGAMLFIKSDPIGPPNVGLSQDDFLRKWGAIIFIAKYNGMTKRIVFDQTEVKSFLPRPPAPFPHVSPLKER
jgi:hypothetical protein